MSRLALYGVAALALLGGAAAVAYFVAPSFYAPLPSRPAAIARSGPPETSAQPEPDASTTPIDSLINDLADAAASGWSALFATRLHRLAELSVGASPEGRKMALEVPDRIVARARAAAAAGDTEEVRRLNNVLSFVSPNRANPEVPLPSPGSTVGVAGTNEEAKAPLAAPSLSAEPPGPPARQDRTAEATPQAPPTAPSASAEAPEPPAPQDRTAEATPLAPPAAPSPSAEPPEPPAPQDRTAEATPLATSAPAAPSPSAEPPEPPAPQDRTAEGAPLATPAPAAPSPSGEPPEPPAPQDRTAEATPPAQPAAPSPSAEPLEPPALQDRTAEAAPVAPPAPAAPSPSAEPPEPPARQDRTAEAAPQAPPAPAAPSPSAEPPEPPARQDRTAEAAPLAPPAPAAPSPSAEPLEPPALQDRTAEATPPAATVAAPEQKLAAIATPKPGDAARSPDTSGLPEFAPIRVVLKTAKDSPARERRAGEVRQALASAGFDVAGPAPAEARLKGPAIGYYFQSDRAAAAAVSRLLAPLLGVVTPAALKMRGAAPQPGTIEIALP